jgi:Flp pilus assembly protein TadD
MGEWWMMGRRPGTAALVGGVAIAVLGVAGIGGALFVRSARARAQLHATYVGEKTCASCHAAEAARWRGSHHDLAMQRASDSTVAGNFDDATITSPAGVTTTFTRRADQFFVRTDGPDGTLHDFDVRYTFGVAPLQQYLVELPGGRLQALNIAWDTRTPDKGGEQWFSLYPGQRIAHNDDLHWTGLRQNWNYACAECHSTTVRKNYDAVSGRFATTFEAPNVSCEACHGPGSAHADSKGRVSLAPTTRARQVESCARCHSRRTQFTDDYVLGQPLEDTHRIALLDTELYHPDGQIRGEVFEYGSFVQSRMYARGVTCSDCHDPHSATLKLPDGASAATASSVCSRCHAPEKYQTPKHHFHTIGSAGSDCVGCHMPTTTYMVVDRRHDHSIRVPRPDLSVSIGVPNACNKCHTTRSVSWAALQVESWYGRTPNGYQRYAEAFAASSLGDSTAKRLLTAVVRDDDQPAIARATAMQHLIPLFAGWTDTAFALVQAGLADTSPLVRRATVTALAESDSLSRARLLTPLLGDKVRAVRMEAARALADLTSTNLTEYVVAERFNSDRPEAGVNLGLMYMAQRRYEDAEREMRASLKVDSRFVPAFVNLAELYRATGREAQAEKALRDAVRIDSANTTVHHALRLVIERRKKVAEALSRLVNQRLQRRDNAGALVYARRLASLEPGNPDVQALVQRLSAAEVR